jgi:hypothetical protein
MAQGDAQRVWFPEMIERLRATWLEGMSFDDLIALRDEQDEMLQRIRQEGDIHSSIIKCKKCGYKGEEPAPHVSVRAMILSFHRFGIAAAEPVHDLEKSWAAHRKQNGLDLCGKPADPASIPSCPHR